MGTKNLRSLWTKIHPIYLGIGDSWDSRIGDIINNMKKVADIKEQFVIFCNDMGLKTHPFLAPYKAHFSESALKKGLFLAL